MHMQGEPRTMQQDPRYTDVVAEVRAFLAERVEACIAGGIARERLLIDPGFGFGKKLQHNLMLLEHTSALAALGLPLLVGVSRKSFLGTLTGAPTGERVHAGVAAAVIAVRDGAALVRTHDVAPTVAALRICAALEAL